MTEYEKKYNRLIETAHEKKMEGLNVFENYMQKIMDSDNGLSNMVKNANNILAEAGFKIPSK